jgi:UDP-glucose 4-epimerase
VSGSKHILVTGGAGYIGSHTAVELLNAGYAVTVVDSFCNSSPIALTRVESITGKKIQMVRADIRDRSSLVQALRESQAEAVIHFAGLKAVGDSVKQPLAYYDNNVIGTLRLLEAMQDCEVKTLVFSSSATVYGDPLSLPFREDHRLLPTSPYGRTKLHIESMLRDLHCSLGDWKIAILRYFNPVGAHPSGLIGEDPSGVPNNLMPFLSQVAVGRRDYLNVFGSDYPTRDGTGVRDYIHVVDLADGHLRALAYLESLSEDAANGSCIEINLGTGMGHSVLELVKAFELASGQKIPYQIKPRRPGDIAEFYADPRLAADILGWTAKFDLQQICKDSWRWQSMNPNGYISNAQ